MSKKITIDFFKVVVQSSLPNISSFEDIIQKTASISTDQRYRHTQLHPVSLLEADYGWNNTWEGEIVQLRMDNMPVIGDLSGKIEDLQLSDDKGLGEQSAFVYDPQSTILAIQTNRNGVSTGNFARYFELIAEGNTDVILNPVIQMDAMQRLHNMKNVTKMDINVAGLSNMGIFDTGKNGIEEMIKLTDFYDAPSVRVEMKASGKKEEKKYLSKEKVLNLAQSLLRVRNSATSEVNVKTIRITGKSSEEDNLFVDLLKDKFLRSWENSQKY